MKNFLSRRYPFLIGAVLAIGLLWARADEVIDGLGDSMISSNEWVWFKNDPSNKRTNWPAEGGGSGDLTEVQVSGGLLSVASGTGPIPIVTLTTATVQAIAAPLLSNSNIWNSAVTNGTDTATIDLTLTGLQLSAALSNTTVTAGTYTWPTQFVVDAQGRLTSANSGAALGNLAYSNSALFVTYLGGTYLTIAGASLTYYPLLNNPAGYATNGTPISLGTLPSAGVSGMVTNPVIYFANGVATSAVSAAEAAGGSSLSWQRWEQHANGVDLIPAAISNNWGVQSARIADGTRYIAGAGAATYYSNATQLAELMVTFRANALKTVYTDTNNTLAVSWWVVGVTNSANASWFLKAYGNQEGANGAVTNSVLIYTNTTAYVTDAASGIPTFTAVPMSSLFNTNIFPSYTFDIFPTLLATNPSTEQAIYFGPMGGGM